MKTTKKKVLILTNHRKNRSPGQRFRFEQYLDILEQNGFEIDFSILLNEKDDRIFYSKGNYFSKMIILIKTFLRRFGQIFTVSKYDVIFIFRESYFMGTTFFEKNYRRFSRALFLFDFDDAIWIEAESIANKRFSWLKNAAKTSDIIALCDVIMAGNQYLKDYSLRYNKTVYIVPTTIDTNEYQPLKERHSRSSICVGWSGSFSTIEHFKTVIDALRIIKIKYKEKVYFKVIGDGNYRNEELQIKGIAWSKKDEIKELQEIDIGIMPLPDDDWAKGKCGLKGLQYMALSIPTIMSPVGVNSDIIQDGHNGFLASSTQEWVNKLSILLDDENLRYQIGEAGRKTVVDHYSIEANKNKYLEIFSLS